MKLIETCVVALTLGSLVVGYCEYMTGAKDKAIDEAQKIADERERQIECIEQTGKMCPTTFDIDDFETDIDEAVDEFESVLEDVENGSTQN